MSIQSVVVPGEECRIYDLINCVFSIFDVFVIYHPIERKVLIKRDLSA